MPLDRHGVLLLERRRAAEQARVGKVHHGPQVGQPVLDRSAGDRDPVRCGEGTYGDCLLGRGVFDGLCLVDHDPAPPHCAQVASVAGGNRVRGNYHIDLPHRLFERGTTRALGTMMNMDPQVRRKASSFALPVPYQ
jgi:hypothetical protein